MPLTDLGMNTYICPTLLSTSPPIEENPKRAISDIEFKLILPPWGETDRGGIQKSLHSLHFHLMQGHLIIWQ